MKNLILSQTISQLFRLLNLAGVLVISASTLAVACWANPSTLPEGAINATAHQTSVAKLLTPHVQQAIELFMQDTSSKERLDIPGNYVKRPKHDLDKTLILGGPAALPM